MDNTLYGKQFIFVPSSPWRAGELQRFSTLPNLLQLWEDIKGRWKRLHCGTDSCIHYSESGRRTEVQNQLASEGIQCNMLFVCFLNKCTKPQIQLLVPTRVSTRNQLLNNVNISANPDSTCRLELGWKLDSGQPHYIFIHM